MRLVPLVGILVALGAGCDSSIRSQSDDGSASGSGGAGATTGGTGPGGSSSATGGAGGGQAGNPNDCPSASPTRDQACTADPMSICNYEGVVCACRSTTGSDPTSWRCVDCPLTQPENGTACTPPTAMSIGGLVCSYPSGEFCTCESGTWRCRCRGCP